MKNKILFNKAKSAINTSNIAPTLKANFNPWTVPFEMASSILLSFWASSILMLFSIELFWLGIIIFAIATAPGAAITDAAIKLVVTFNFSAGSSPPKRPTYPANTEPATVAIPPTITV